MQTYYAAILGAVVLRSKKPITEADLKEAAMLAHKNARILPMPNGEIVLSLNLDLLK